MDIFAIILAAPSVIGIIVMIYAFNRSEHSDTTNI
jgi:hypothetical protein